MSDATTPSPDTDSVVVRFAGDSGDGVQILGSQFAEAAAAAGNDFTTFPDFPAEIRAPVGTTFGVSAFQINLGARRILTAGDTPDVLVAFNPAALKVSLPRLEKGALIILNTDAFTARNFAKAGIETDPRETGELDDFRVVEIDITARAQEAVKPLGLGARDADRCKNFWALGTVCWMFGKDRAPIEEFLRAKFAKKELVRDANLAALNAGHAYAETAELSADTSSYRIGAAQFESGEYRTITGGEALAYGLAAAGELADRKVMFCSYPITPASPLLHYLARLGETGVATFQAEDEIAAVCAAIGASYGGALGITSSSGPGIALKTEAIGLAMITELPLVIVNSQRGGPSTGLPTKTEQSDLYQAVYGRNADAPLPVVATSRPGDCFNAAVEAARIAIRHMTPVFLLTDGYIANAAGPWALPDVAAIPPIKTHDFDPATRGDKTPGEVAFSRDPETLGRPWIKPGAPDLMHRIGGLEKDVRTGNISYDDANHQVMSDLRAEKVAKIAKFLPKQDIDQGGAKERVALVGWGSTYGPISRAVQVAREQGASVAHIHITYLNPFPDNLAELLAGYDKIVVPEMNMGQLATLLRDKLKLDPIQLNKVSGQPFKIAEILEAIETHAAPSAVAAQ